MGFAIRRADVDDAQAIWHVHQESVRRLCTDHYSPREIRSWIGGRRPSHFRWGMVKAGEIVFVAESEKEVIGFSSLRSLEVQAVYVAPSWVRKGVGSSLYKAVEEYARAQRLQRLELHATLTAVLFYERLGFTRVRPTAFELMDGTRLHCIRMAKELG